MLFNYCYISRHHKYDQKICSSTWSAVVLRSEPHSRRRIVISHSIFGHPDAFELNCYKQILRTSWIDLHLFIIIILIIRSSSSSSSSSPRPPQLSPPSSSCRMSFDENHSRLKIFSFSCLLPFLVEFFDECVFVFAHPTPSPPTRAGRMCL